MTLTKPKYACACGFQTDNLGAFKRHLLDGGQADGKGVHKSLKNAAPAVSGPSLTQSQQQSLDRIEELLQKRVDIEASGAAPAREPGLVTASDNKKKGKKDKVEEVKTNSLVIRYMNGRYIGRYQYIDDPVGIPYSTKGNEWIYLFAAHSAPNPKTGEPVEELRPLSPMNEIKVLPETLYRKLHKWWSYRQVMNEALKPSFMEKLKMGAALTFLAISATLTFLIVISLMG